MPSPAGSGRAMRAWQWLVELSREHQVHVWIAEKAEAPGSSPHGFSAGCRGTGKAGAPILPAGTVLWHGAGDVLPARTWARRLGWLLPALPRCAPRTMADWRFPRRKGASFSALRDALEGQRVARVLVFRMYLHEVGAALQRRLRAESLELDMDDLESLTRLSVAGALLRLRRPLEALLRASEAVQYRMMEKRIADCYHKTWLAAPEDLARAGPTAALQPNRLVRPALSRKTVREDTRPLELLFVGGLDYPPNEEATWFLLDAVIPALRVHLTASVPTLRWRLTIIGRRAPARLHAALRQRRAVRFLPCVEELSPYYAQADIVLVPLFAGGGSKLKTIEAFAHCRAVISTREGVRGLGARPGEEYLAAESAQEFARAIADLARDERRRNALAEAGRRVYEGSFVLEVTEER